MSNLRVISLNCRSLAGNRKRLQLQDYLARYKPDVVFLQETRLAARHRIRIAGYTFVYLPIAPSPQSGSAKDVGTAIALREGTAHTVVNSTLSVGFGSFVEVTVSGNKVLMGSVYLHNHTASNATLAFSELRELTMKYTSVIFGGDLNVHFSPLNSNGKALESFLSDDSHYVKLFSPDQPTRPQSGNFLDHFLLKDENSFLDSPLCTTLDLFSDHCGILLRFGRSLPLHLLKEDPRTMLSYEGVNWKSFNELVDLRMRTSDKWCLVTNADIDNAIEELTTAVKLATDKFMVRNCFREQIRTPP